MSTKKDLEEEIKKLKDGLEEWIKDHDAKGYTDKQYGKGKLKKLLYKK